MTGQMGQVMTTIAAKPVALLLQAAQSDHEFEIARASLRHRPGGSMDVLVPLSFFAMVVVIVWLGARRRQTQIKAQSELRKQVLDRFGSAQELTTFMESKGGQQFFGEMPSRATGQLRFLYGGVIATMLGLAFLGLTLMRRNFIFPAVIVLAVGIGLLISAFIAHTVAKKIEPLPPQN